MTTSVHVSASFGRRNRDKDGWNILSVAWILPLDFFGGSDSLNILAFQSGCVNWGAVPGLGEGALGQKLCLLIASMTCLYHLSPREAVNTASFIPPTPIWPQYCPPVMFTAFLSEDLVVRCVCGLWQSIETHFLHQSREQTITQSLLHGKLSTETHL